MASIERTAYPRLKQQFTKAELRDFYTPTAEEILFVLEKSRRGETRLHLLALLKTFQKLGYFQNLEDISESLLRFLRFALNLPADII
jgi:lipid A disaccharide synthetase